MPKTAKLLKLEVYNLGCIGNEGLQISLDNIVCLVGENNAGKSTALKAYEMAVGSGSYNFESDHCKMSSETELTQVILDIHIPVGVANIGEQWKIVQGSYHVVRTKWTWDENNNQTRQTYNPAMGDYDPDNNASGLDNVFISRLPKPIRIGALESPESNFNNLKKILLGDIAVKLENLIHTPKTPINKALDKIKKEIGVFLAPMENAIQNAQDKIQTNHEKIFPNIDISFNLGFSEIKVKALDNLLKGSDLTFKEFDQEIKWDSQGTGSKRALFWTFIGIHSELNEAINIEKNIQKEVVASKKEITKIVSAIKKVIKEETKKRKRIELREEWNKCWRLQRLIKNKSYEKNDKNSIFPSYILLLDEPEIALHPSAIQAASDLLYEFAEDKNWQVILSTHSPEFIDPFEDHTTIVRVERKSDKSTPSTYRASEIIFDPIEKENLKLLNLFEHSISQMFFGQYPIIVEGDTEYGSFLKIMNDNPLEYHKNARPIVIRARGKYQIISIMKMLIHFKCNFSVLHDIDYPKTKTKKVNSAWVANSKIYDEIIRGRALGLKIIHRVSCYTFEAEHDSMVIDSAGKIKLTTSGSKPFKLISKLKSGNFIYKSIKYTLDSLIESAIEEPIGNPFNTELPIYFDLWVKHHKITNPQFKV